MDLVHQHNIIFFLFHNFDIFRSMCSGILTITTLAMRGERRAAVIVVREQSEDNDDSEVSFSVAYEKLVEEATDVSSAIQYHRFEADSEINSDKTEKGSPYKVCGGRSKDRKGIVATSFTELVEKGRRTFD